MAPRAAARALDAAGISDPRLRAAYEVCRRLNATHGRTYYLATLLLPPAKRPYVHALYGFARYADDLVDSRTDPRPDELALWARAALTEITQGMSSAGSSNDPVVLALTDTMRRWSIPIAHVEAFLDSMLMDLDVISYDTYSDLERYMYGSAAVIGLQMVAILEPLPGRDAQAAAAARALGEAFQLSNFLRDVAEDLDRGRVYLPLADCARFGVGRADLERRVLTPQIRDLLVFEIERTRGLYHAAEAGIPLLHPTSRDCIRTAVALYGGILGEIERAGYDIFAGRVSVPTRRRLAVAGPGWARAVRARRR